MAETQKPLALFKEVSEEPLTAAKILRFYADEMWDLGFKDISTKLHAMAREYELAEKKLRRRLMGATAEWATIPPHFDKKSEVDG